MSNYLLCSLLPSTATALMVKTQEVPLCRSRICLHLQDLSKGMAALSPWNSTSLLLPSASFWPGSSFSSYSTVKYLHNSLQQHIFLNQNRKNTIHSAAKSLHLPRLCCVSGTCKLFLIAHLIFILSFCLSNVAVPGLC